MKCHTGPQIWLRCAARKRIRLKYDIKIKDAAWIRLAQDRVQRQALA